MIIEETCEVVIAVESAKNKTQAALESELKSLRRQGFEVELCLRGSWYRRGSPFRRPSLLHDLAIETWRIEEERLVTPGTGMWIPGVRKKPPPEVVLRGIRRSS